MSVKSIAFEVSRRSGVSRTHAYELIAAAFGHNSYAAFKAAAVPMKMPLALARPQNLDRARIFARYAVLTRLPASVENIAGAVERVLEEHSVISVRLADVVQTLLWWRENESDYSSELPSRYVDGVEPALPELFREGGPIPELLEALFNAAEGDNPLAHYAIALGNEWSHFATESREPKPYWYQQRQAGKALSAAASDWADQYERFIEGKRLYERHLRTAAKLGNQNALFDLTCNFGDPAFFDGGHELPGVEPAELSRIASEVARPGAAQRYLTKAAEGGDIQAMRELIETFDAGDLVTCWKWVYLARHCGVDLTKDQHVAINEDGSRYDFDVGGSAFVGGEDGVSLKALDSEQDRIAREAASLLFRESSLDPQAQMR